MTMPPTYYEKPYVMKDRKLDIKPSDYTLALKIKNGHRYFWLKEQRLPPERGGYGDVLAIADDSGEYPHLTDDGLLYVDWASDIVAGGDNRQASVPLIDLEGNRSSTPVNIFEAFSVARLLGLGITILDPHSDKEIAVSAASLYWDNGKL